MPYEIVDIPFGTSTASIVVNDPIPDDFPDWAGGTGGGLTDGIPPANSPAAIVTGGLNYLVVTWDATVNHDPVTYDVYISTVNGFTPGPTTFFGSTPATILFVNSLSGGAPLAYETTYYIQIISRDGDGSAAPGTQGSAQIIELPTNQITSDGVPPSSSPTPSVSGAFGVLVASWAPVVNADLVTYNVYLSTTTGFTPGSGNLAGQTTGTTFVFRDDPNTSSALVEGTTYYVKIISTDPDGSASAGGQSSAVLALVDGTADIVAGSIEAVSIAAGTITATQIQTGTITAASGIIGSLSASVITTGTLDASVVSVVNLDASDITTGIIDASVIEVSNIDATNINTGTLNASLIGAGTIEGNLILGGTFETSTSNPRTVIDASGVNIYDASGNTILNVPDTGSASFSGNITTGAITIDGNMTISGSTNVMNQGSALTLNEGFANPNIAPTVTYGLDTLTMGFTYRFQSYGGGGLAYNPNGASGGSTKTWALISDQYNTVGQGAYLEEYDATTGAFIRTHQLDPGGTLNASYWLGCAVIGSNIWCCFVSGTSAIKVIELDTATWTAGAAVRLGSGTAVPGMGFSTDGTSLFTFQFATSTSHLSYSSYTTSGTLNSTTTTTGGTVAGGTTPDTGSAPSAAWDGTSWWVSMGRVTQSGKDFAFVEKYTSGAYVADSRAAWPETFLGVTDNGWTGLAWDSTNSHLWSYTGIDLNMFSWSTLAWTTGTDKWYHAFVWNDGSHVTLPSPITSGLNLATGVTGSPQMYGRFSVTVPTFPATIVEVDLYADNASSTPALSALKLQAPTTYASSNSVSMFEMYKYNASGAAPPVSNDFPGGTSAILGTASILTAPWKVGGDGTFLLPVGTITQRASMIPTQGQLLWNKSGAPTNTGGIDVYDGTVWRSQPRHYRESGSEGLQEAMFEMAQSGPTLLCENFDSINAMGSLSARGLALTQNQVKWLALWWPGGAPKSIFWIQETAGSYTDTAPVSGFSLWGSGGTPQGPVLSTDTTLALITNSKTTVVTSNMWEQTAGLRSRNFATSPLASLLPGIYYASIYYHEDTVSQAPLLGGISYTFSDLWNASSNFAPIGFPLQMVLAAQSSIPTGAQTISGLDVTAVSYHWIGMG